MIRTKSAEERKIRDSWKIGDSVQVYSTSGDGWYKGKITGFREAKNSTSVIEVEYARDGQTYKKEMGITSTEVRPLEELILAEFKEFLPPKIMRSQSILTANALPQIRPTEKPPGASVQRKLLKTVTEPSSLKPGETRCLLPFGWFKAWKAYTIGGKEPGPILIHSLVVETNTDKLRRGIKEGRDYVIVTESLCKKLVSWFGGHAPICRIAKESGVLRRKTALDLYPVILSIVKADSKTGDPDNSTISKHTFSRKNHLVDILQYVSDKPKSVVRKKQPISLEVNSAIDCRDSHGYWYSCTIADRFETKKGSMIEINFHDPKYSDPKYNEKIYLFERHRFARFKTFARRDDQRDVKYKKGDYVWARDRVIKKQYSSKDKIKWSQAEVDLVKEDARMFRVIYEKSYKQQYWFHADSIEVQPYTSEKPDPKLPMDGMLENEEEDEENVVLKPKDAMRIWLSGSKRKWDLAPADAYGKTLGQLKLETGAKVLVEEIRDDGTWTRTEVKTNWRDDLCEGSIVDCLDTYNKWYESEVMGIRVNKEGQKEVHVHYIGFDEKWDEWIETNSKRIQPQGSKAGTQKGHAPTGPPEARGAVGLYNLGNTCYINSIIQCLSNVSDLSEYFLDQSYTQDINIISDNKGRMAEAYAQVMEKLWDDQHKVISPKVLRMEVGKACPEFQGYKQQDSHDLLTVLLDGLSKDLNRAPIPPKRETKETQEQRKERHKKEEAEWQKMNLARKFDHFWQRSLRRSESIITDIFTGVERQTVKCLTCNNESIRFSEYTFLAVDIPKKSSWLGMGSPTIQLDDCLKTYVTKEVIAGVKCTKCKEKRSKSKQTLLQTMPEVLIIQLKRFCMGWLGGEKVNAYIDFPITGLKPKYLMAESKNPTYDLIAVSNHFGSTRGGHYTAYAKNPLSGKWYKFDDSDVREVRQSSVVTKQAYVLFYKLRK
uniref:Ubiquitin carboxyl-terminal hydrolase n=1 Tax=Amorphochlora amoebiformis TaxID=1561963 RepID=A0A7S0DQW3_9EUKA|mmetsp:Transcript_6621/g.10221  ORF Transcript_6621/g.10221 Transcript_6621/m.10221 type:complete len:940 (+) Transcript_6621:115-2934(+)